MSRNYRLDLGDWIKGHAEHLELQYLFGDKSDFALTVLEKLRSPLIDKKSWFNILSDRLRKTWRIGDPEIHENHHKFLGALANLNFAHEQMEADSDPGTPGARTKSFKNAKVMLVKAIESLTDKFGGSGIIKNLTSDAVPNRAEMELFRELFGDHRERLGYWLALDLMQQVLEESLLPGISMTTDFSAVVPVLFWNKDEKNGYVLWLKVELFSDYPGPFYPDLTKFGLTDISELMEPMAKVWLASGVHDRFRGRWSITSQHPDNLQEFYQEPIHLEDLSGASLQAAALAAVWAASGEIPLSAKDKDGNPEFYSLGDNQSIKLNPHVAISAQIKPIDGQQNDSIKLGGISDESITGKIEALVCYGKSPGQISGAFDTVLIVRDETDVARSKFPRSEEDNPDYPGIHLVENCDTMADALFWMLEVNAIKKEIGAYRNKQWEDLWGYARDADGLFLGKTDYQPIRFQNPRLSERQEDNGLDLTATKTADSDKLNITWKDEWEPYVGCPIKVDDDTQEVTLEMDPSNEEQRASSLSVLLTSGLRAELDRQVQQAGINTGSLEFMQNPFPGATGHGLDNSTESQELKAGLDGKSVEADLENTTDTTETDDAN